MDLTSKKISELREIAKTLDIKNIAKLKKDELISQIENNSEKKTETKKAQELTLNEGDNMVSGVLEVLPENGFGFLILE